MGGVPVVDGEEHLQDPVLTAAGVADSLGVHRNTATAALTQCRAERMADVMEQCG
ncbi:hypothetical protein [Streptomyces solaniscabiei]|uniref:hypothetical protein n=1 Tax=Streptomyces solaniscabiei TaxID=2683255 RepID=UPI001CE38097|nr:hypothetical protein [Streptomyces solaniscabiei]